MSFEIGIAIVLAVIGAGLFLSSRTTTRGPIGRRDVTGGIPWQVALAVTSVVGLALLLAALLYPVFAPAGETTKTATAHLWSVFDTVLGVWIGLFGGKTATT